MRRKGESMTSKFGVKVEVGRYEETCLIISRNGQVTSLSLHEPVREIPQIIEVLKQHLESLERDRSIPVQPATRGRDKLFKEI